jgi:hypothetical protein
LNSSPIDLSNGEWYSELVSEAITYYSAINVEPKDIKILSPEEMAALKSGGGGTGAGINSGISVGGGGTPKQGAPQGSAGLPSATASKNAVMKNQGSEGTKARAQSPSTGDIESTAGMR